MKNILTCLVIVTLIGGVLFSCGNQIDAGGLEMQHGWVRAMPPGKGMTAAYGELRNTGKEAIRIVGFDSNAFSSVSLHQTTEVDGVSRMRERKDVEIGPGEAINLQPGGLHLMLMGAEVEIAAGSEVEIGISSATQRYVFSLPVETR
jgi:copper(I)-binding protein